MIVNKEVQDALRLYLLKEQENLDSLNIDYLERFKAFLSITLKSKEDEISAFLEFHKFSQSISIQICLAEKKSKQKKDLKFFKEILNVLGKEIVYHQN